MLGLSGRASSDREFYEAVYRRLVELYPLPEYALPELAARRAGAIVEYLTGSAGIGASHVESGDARAVHVAADEPIPAKLALDVEKAPRDASRSARGRPDGAAATLAAGIPERW